MKVCYFGNYQPDYPRNNVLISGLRQIGVEVVECRTRLSGIRKYWSLYRQHRRLKGGYDVMIVGFSGFALVWFARLLTCKALVFDAFVSLYLTNVEDRKIFSPNSMKARYYAFLDKWACRISDRVLLDTNAQIEYFVSRYRIPFAKFSRIFVGADPQIFYPAPATASRGSFIVHWHGHIVPFHGLPIVLEAARLLLGDRGIEFRITTRFNSKYEKARLWAAEHSLSNVHFLPEASYEELADRIRASDIVLGIFGNGVKAGVVIPNKIIEAAACAKPIITARHKVLNELFTEDKNIALVSAENPQALADKILYLKGNPGAALRLGGQAGELYGSMLKPATLGRELLHALS